MCLTLLCREILQRLPLGLSVRFEPAKFRTPVLSNQNRINRPARHVCFARKDAMFHELVSAFAGLVIIQGALFIVGDVICPLFPFTG